MARILVVDDEQETRELLSEFLNLRGYEVLTASDGFEALTTFKSERPHIVLLDTKMPGLDGVEVLRRIRALDKEVGVIMVTGVKDEKVGEYALKLGANDCLTKPIDLDDLEKSVYAKLLMMAAVTPE
ncbi:MAG: response regulator [Gemmatimonadota bacterium]|nr:MAG: response regulator [Gemmatimonadota bacterium]